MGLMCLSKYNDKFSSSIININNNNNNNITIKKQPCFQREKKNQCSMNLETATGCNHRSIYWQIMQKIDVYMYIYVIMYIHFDKTLQIFFYLILGTVKSEGSLEIFTI